MQSQPAHVNYFFGDVYRDTWEIIKGVFSRWIDSIGNSGSMLLGSFVVFLSHLKDIVINDGIISRIVEFGKTMFYCAIFGFYLAYFICNTILTPIICAIFTVFFLIVMAIVMVIIYIMFTIVSFIDFLYRRLHKLKSGCPVCGEKFDLPYYVCPDCGEVHTRLLPSKYGILKRTCDCGAMLPTTFLNGRGKLSNLCPNCYKNNKTTELAASAHTETWIPLVGGSQCGKSCYISMAISTIEDKTANANNLDFKYVDQEQFGRTDKYSDSIAALKQGQVLPPTDTATPLTFYQFELQNHGSNISNLISLCDIAGEFYDSKDEAEWLELADKNKGFASADAFIVLIDPLSIKEYKKEVIKTHGIDPVAYGASERDMDDVMSSLVNLLEKFKKQAGGKFKPIAAVVLTKNDLPGLEDKIGETAVADYMSTNNVSRLQAYNAVCEQFLNDYDEGNLINTLKNRFTAIQYFSCSALGRVADATNSDAFEAVNVEDPILWVVGKKTALDFSSYLDTKR